MEGTDQIRSVAQSYPTLCDPMNRSTPGLPVCVDILGIGREKRTTSKAGSCLGDVVDVQLAGLLDGVQSICLHGGKETGS